MSKDDYYLEYLASWQYARYPLGEGPVIEEAWKAACASRPPAAAAQKLSDPQKLLLCSLCRELQRRAVDKDFYLACRKVQQLFGLDEHVTAYRWLMGLTRLNILLLTKRGTRGERGKANRFRYLLPLDD